MKSKGSTETPRIKEAIARSVDFEITVADMARRSERRAWWVATSAIVLCLVLAGSYFFVLPLKEKVPYLVMADAYTGTSTVARLREDFRDNNITTSEAIARSNVAHYLQARESYDYDIMRLRDWATVNTMSAGDAMESLKVLYNSPQSPYRIYGKTRAIRIKINNIVPIGGNGKPYIGATVSFQRLIFNKTSGTIAPLDNKIATMGFSYDPTLKMDDKARIANPLGFQVTTYRIDNDYSSPPPSEIPINSVEQVPVDAPANTMPIPVPGQSAATMQANPAASQAAPQNNNANGVTNP